MTFEQFQATRTWCDDLGKAIAGSYFEDYAQPATGYLYAGELFVESFEGDWVLIIGNVSGRSSDLAAMERDLFEFAQSEGYFTNP